jgi:hypothetical protein
LPPPLAPPLSQALKQNAQALGDNLDMAAITDNNRSVFKEAAATLLDNFTQEELEQIAATASELQTILTAAKKRDQEKFRKVR